MTTCSIVKPFKGTHCQNDIFLWNSIFYLFCTLLDTQLVRYFLRKSQQEAPATAVDRYLSQIDSVVFTDSNHNINWVSKKLPTVAKFLQGPRCLYVKSHKVHEKQKHLGERHHNCEYWKHRFGSIKTIWAGTREHALTNYTSRFHILDHFDLVGNHLDGVEYNSTAPFVQILENLLPLDLLNVHSWFIESLMKFAI